MNLHIHPTDRDVAQQVAERLSAAARANPALVLGLPTGRTPVPIYRRLAAMHLRGLADFSRVTTFNLDEFVGLAPSHPGSYRAFMERHLFRPVGIDPARVHFLNGLAVDLAAECDRYENDIAATGGIDIQVLGIGANGHIGFNEPAASLEARTHRACLRPQTRRANATFFGRDVSRVPPEALSMGVATILQARELMLVATGRSKWRAVVKMVEGSVTTRLPASFLQLHPRVDVFLDDDAASGLAPSAGARASRAG